MSLNCYNACFLMVNNSKYFLVDSGGGAILLKQLKLLNIKPEDIHDIFISHIHIDHMLGCIWLIRYLLPKYYKNRIEKETRIYGSNGVIEVIKELCNLLMPDDFKYLLGTKIVFIKITDNYKCNIIDNEYQFFDLQSYKVQQFGFNTKISNEILSFIGDECYSEKIQKYIENSKWLIADAYTCGEDAEKDDPVKNHHHSSVKYISKIADNLNIKNLILIHTLDNDLDNRRKKFTIDAKKYYNGNVIIPDDLETIIID